MDAVPNSHACAVENASEVHIHHQISFQNAQTFRKPANLLKDPLLIADDPRVLCRGFCIREYVGKVRSENVTKCWPFSETLLNDNLRDGRNQLLPPLVRPNYRWWASQHTLETDGKQESLGTSCHQMQRHRAQRESHTGKIEGIMVSLDPISDKDPGFSKDLDEQIRKFSRVKISGEDDITANQENGGRIRDSKVESRVDNGHRQSCPTPPFVRATSSTAKCTSQLASERKLPRQHTNGKAGTDVPAKENQNGKPDTAMHKASVNQKQLRAFTFDSMGREYKSLSDGAGFSEEIDNAKTAIKGTQVQVTAGSILMQSERNKIDNLNESVRHGISDISDNDVSGVKVCPVCKTFSSTTITAVNAHIDECLGQASKIQKKQGKMHRLKSRTQKKRSMIDICAAAPLVESPLDYSESLAMEESAATVPENRKLKKAMAPTGTCVESAIPDVIPTFHCKRKKTNEARSPAIGGAEERKAESVKPKVKRQRLGTGSSVSNAVEALKMPSAAPHSKETDHVVQHNPKASSITVDATDSNVEQLLSMQGDSGKNNLAKNQHQQSGIHSANMFSKENKAKESSIYNNVTLEEESGMLLGEENAREPFTILTMANAATDVSFSYGMKDAVPPWNQSSHSDHDNSDLLDDNECRHHKAYNTDSSRLQVQEASKPQDPNFLNFSNTNTIYKKITSFDRGGSGEPGKSDGDYSKSECSAMHSLEEESTSVQPEISDQNLEPVKSKNDFVAKIDGMNARQGNVKHYLGDICNNLSTQRCEWKKENSKALRSSQKEKLIWEARKITEGAHMTNARLNLNKKVCVLPRDSKGRFLSSHSMNKEGYIHYRQQKQTCSHKYTKPPKNFPKPSSVEKEASHVEPHLSENPMGLEKFNIHGKCSDYGYEGFPLDSQGELIKNIPNTISGFNQLYKIPNYSAANEPLISQGTTALQEFNFVESIKTFPDGNSVKQPLQICDLKCLPQQSYSIQCKQPDYQQEYSAFKTNQSNPDKRGSQYSSMLAQILRDGSSQIRIAGSSIGTPDTISMVSMQATNQIGCNDDQRKKATVLEKNYPEVDITTRKQFATQSVMRLMGQSFTIGNENEAGNALKDLRQCNSKDSKNISEATIRVSSSMQLMTDYMDHCIACNISKSFPNTLKEVQSQEMSCNKIIATHEVSTLNNDAPNLVEKRLHRDCVLHGQPLQDQSHSGQAWISSPPFFAPIANMLISPVSYLCNNTSLNEAHKMACKDSHVSNQGCPLQKQTYSHFLPSSSGKHTFQKPVCDGWKHTSNQFSPSIHSDTVESLPCSIRRLGSLSGPLHTATCALANSTSFPIETRSHCQTPSSSTSIADSSTLVMQGKHIYSSINLSEQEKMILKLPSNGTSNRCEASHEKGGVIDDIHFDRKYGDILRTRQSVQETEGLHGKWIFEKYEDYVRVPMQKSDPFSITQELQKRKKIIPQKVISSSVAAKHLKSREILEKNMLDVSHDKICRMNDSWVEFSMDGRNSSNKVVDESILNSRPLTELPQKCPQKEIGLFTKSNNKILETGIRTSTIGLHYSKAGSSLELAEPIKLSGGAKHILKPSSQNGNGKHSFPIHYTLPFADSIAEERERNLEGTKAYRNRDQDHVSPQRSKLMRWSSTSNTSWQQLQ